MTRSGEAAPAGTTPKGTTGEEQAAQYVRVMFGRVARRYDLLNHLLSFQADRYWRERTVEGVESVLSRRDARVLDLCCGTGDLLLGLARRRGALVYGSDFCHDMLTTAQGKIESRNARAALFEADALQLPIADASFDLITIAFGFRNLVNYRRGLEEFLRVLKPGGMLAILEFSQPPNPVFAALYRFYSNHVLPRIGGLVSGSGDAYTYLTESVRKFPDAEGLAAQIEAAGFAGVRFERMTFGIVALHTARAGAAGPS
jgi:demethylmenaquinone methyltransferase / 2-methoxy-6-polyprenyl-1,4-benzoquinol methylase